MPDLPTAAACVGGVRASCSVAAMSASDELQRRNAAYAASFDRTAVPDSPALRAVVITCLDFRVDPAHFAGLRPGEAFVLRVLGGRVTDAVADQVATVLALMAEAGRPLAEVVVVHHTECATSRFLDPAVAEAVGERAEVAVAPLAALAVDDPRRTVRADLEALGRRGMGSKVTGYVYDLEDGTLVPV